MTDRGHGPGGPQATPPDPWRTRPSQASTSHASASAGAAGVDASSHGAGPPDDAPQAKPPHLDESIRRVRSAGRQTVGSGVDAGRALRRLVSADLALARSSLGRALAWSAVSIVFGASNAVHGSDAPETAKFEIGYFFAEMELVG